MYEFTSRVRYSEIGPDMKMTPIALITRMQDCCVFHSEAIGRGPQVWLSTNCSWMITSWQVKIYKLPEINRRVKTATWPYSFTKLRGCRNFTVHDEDGTLCAEANSEWVYFDLSEMKPVRIPEEEIEAFGIEPKLEFEYAPRRINVPKEGIREEAPFEVSVRDIDTNQHVNNLKYIEMAFAYAPAVSKCSELRVEYIRQCRLGDVICPKVAEKKGPDGRIESVIVSLSNRAGQPCAIVEFILK